MSIDIRGNSPFYCTIKNDNRIISIDLEIIGNVKEKRKMDMIRYEEMAVKAIFTVIAAVAVVFIGLIILGVELITCNPLILFGGIGMVTVIIWLMTVLQN